MWVSSEFSHPLKHAGRWIDYSKLPLGVNMCECMVYCHSYIVRIIFAADPLFHILSPKIHDHCTVSISNQGHIKQLQLKYLPEIKLNKTQNHFWMQRKQKHNK